MVLTYTIFACFFPVSFVEGEVLTSFKIAVNISFPRYFWPRLLFLEKKGLSGEKYSHTTAFGRIFHKKSSASLLAMLNDLLDFSRLEGVFFNRPLFSGFFCTEK